MEKSSETRPRLYALFTESHARMFEEWFRPTLEAGEYDPVVRRVPSQGSDLYMDQGWLSGIVRKIEFILEAIGENQGRMFVFSDVDVQFFGGTRRRVERRLGDRDMVFQRDSFTGILCTGFFACVGSPRTRQVWEAVRDRFAKDPSLHDQQILNLILRGPDRPDVRWAYLPSHFFSVKRPWKPGMKLIVPRRIVMHHANWTRGEENKLAMLREVRRIVQAGKGLPMWCYDAYRILYRTPRSTLGRWRRGRGLDY